MHKYQKGISDSFHVVLCIKRVMPYCMNKSLILVWGDFFFALMSNFYIKSARQ